MNFAESIDTVPENIREVAPAVFFAVPRIWEKFYSAVALRMREATWLGKLAYRWAIGVGMRVAERRIQGQPPSLGLRLMFLAANFLVLDNLKRSIGLHRVRGAATGAAPIAPELIKWYMALGIDMREVYGQTENCGLATAMPHDRIKLGTVGVARAGHRGAHLAAGGDPAARPARLPRLLQEPREDGGDHRRRLAPHGRRRRDRRATASSGSPTA